MHTHAEAEQIPAENPQSYTPQSPGPQSPAAKSRTFFRFRLQAEDAELIRQLPPLYQAVLESEGAYGERAAALNVPIGTVRSRLHRARKALQQLRDAQEQGA
ncbi:MAG TPA: sigma factor-like helix-turn-helix DNA-binding protein [Rhizomicrobium sp.]|nr:sigma factor-like helix-turn-helix DNA-binding protein [Rhizomicrobium sp.]